MGHLHVGRRGHGGLDEALLFGQIPKRQGEGLQAVLPGADGRCGFFSDGYAFRCMVASVSRSLQLCTYSCDVSLLPTSLISRRLGFCSLPFSTLILGFLLPSLLCYADALPNVLLACKVLVGWMALVSLKVGCRVKKTYGLPDFALHHSRTSRCVPQRHGGVTAPTQISRPESSMMCGKTQ